MLSAIRRLDTSRLSHTYAVHELKQSCAPGGSGVRCCGHSCPIGEKSLSVYASWCAVLCAGCVPAHSHTATAEDAVLRLPCGRNMPPHGSRGGDHIMGAHTSAGEESSQMLAHATCCNADNTFLTRTCVAAAVLSQTTRRKRD